MKVSYEDIVKAEKRLKFEKSGMRGIVIGLILLVPTILLFSVTILETYYRFLEMETFHEIPKVVSSDAIRPENEGAYIQLVDTLYSHNQIVDPLFNVAVDSALVLIRSVKMYQWLESKRLGLSPTSKKEDDSKNEMAEIPTYRVALTEQLINSSLFIDTGKANPDSFPINALRIIADSAVCGEFTVGKEYLSLTNDTEFIPINSSKGVFPVINGVKSKLNNNSLFYGKNPKKPQVGDIEISFYAVLPHIVTLFGKQNNGSLIPFNLSDTKTHPLLIDGEKLPEKTVLMQIIPSYMLSLSLFIVSMILLRIFVGSICSGLIQYATLHKLKWSSLFSNLKFVLLKIIFVFIIITRVVVDVTYFYVIVT